MAVKNLKNIPVYLWQPPENSPVYKIEVETSSGDTYNVTDLVIEGEYTYGVTSTIGDFKFTIDNSAQQYLDVFSTYDKINVYMDYSKNATTKRFTGMIEKVRYTDSRIKLSGRSSAARIMGVSVTEKYGGEYSHEIVKDLIDKYCSSYITYNNIDTNEDDDLVTVDWYQKSFWECIKELCERTENDAYIDENFDFNYFPTDSRKNDTEAVVHESNLISTGDFSPNLSNVSNRIVVYGANVEGQQIIWTEEDEDSIDKYDVREKIVNDQNARTVDQAQAKAQYILEQNKNPTITGDVECLALPTLNPGEKVRISDPLNNLDPKYYSIQKYVHQFDNDKPVRTILTVEKETGKISQLLRDRISYESEATEKKNPNTMRYSLIFTFDSDSGSHTNTEITDGVLKTDGSSSGNWISYIQPQQTTDVSACELRVDGNSLSGTKYYVSSGYSFEELDPETITYFSPPGRELKVKIELNSADTEIKSLSLLYK